MSPRKDSRPDLEAAWWTHLPAGGVRRVWAQKRDSIYHCETKTTNAEQEAALKRLCGLDYEADDIGTRVEGDLVSDAQLLAGLEARSLDTADPHEAWVFLGADDAARNALKSADPGIDTRAMRR